MVGSRVKTHPLWGLAAMAGLSAYVWFIIWGYFHADQIGNQIERWLGL